MSHEDRALFLTELYVFSRDNLKLTTLARKKKQLPVLEKVTITDVAAEGKAIARVNDNKASPAILRALWRMRRMQMATSPLRGAALL